jgi:hypothetical protein
MSVWLFYPGALARRYLVYSFACILFAAIAALACRYRLILAAAAGITFVLTQTTWSLACYFWVSVPDRRLLHWTGDGRMADKARGRQSHGRSTPLAIPRRTGELHRRARLPLARIAISAPPAISDFRARSTHLFLA